MVSLHGAGQALIDSLSACGVMGRKGCHASPVHEGAFTHAEVDSLLYARPLLNRTEIKYVHTGAESARGVLNRPRGMFAFI